jgi:hypothetical protein
MIGNIISGSLYFKPLGPQPPVAGPSLWLDATNAASFTYSSGSVVSEWKDLSGNARHFTQATVGYQPERQTNIQNGLPSVYFNSDFLANSSWNWVTSDYTLCVVIKNRTSTTYDGIFSRNSNASIQLGFDNTNKYAISRLGQATSASNLSGTGSNSDVVIYKGSAVAVAGNTTTLMIYKNGTAASSSLSMAINDLGNQNNLGATNSSGADPIVGYISEVLLYPSQLSDANRIVVQDYLKAKWATP